MGTQPPAGRENRRALLDVLANAQNVLPGRDAAMHLDGPVAHLLGVLDHHHGIRAGRQHAAGGDAHSLALLEGALRLLAHFHHADQLEIHRQARGGAERVLGAHRLPIHVRAVKVRQVHRRSQRFGQNPAARL